MEDEDKKFLIDLINDLKGELVPLIKGNRKAIDGNRKAIDGNGKAIEGNRKAIDKNRGKIERNGRLIELNAQAIQRNSKQINQNSKLIEANTEILRHHGVLLDDNNEAILRLAEGQTNLYQRFRKMEDSIGEIKISIADLPAIRMTVSKHSKQIRTLEAK